MFEILYSTTDCERTTASWSKWLKAAKKMRRDLSEEWGFDPLYYNETASVGFLVAAAGRAKLLALPEFTETNRKLPTGRSRAGRCDLWLADPADGSDWVIEFKLHWMRPGSRAGLKKSMNKAIKAAFERDRQEAGSRFACTMYVPWTPSSKGSGFYAAEDFEDVHARLTELATKVDMAFVLGGADRPVHFLCTRIPPRSKDLGRLEIR